MCSSDLGYYFFTIDDVLQKDNLLYLIESKHSKDSILPSSDDIKDGLLKLMLYNNLCEVWHEGKKCDFKVVLRLTSYKLKQNFTLPNENLESFYALHILNNKQKEMLEALNLESKLNNFQIWLEKID